MNNEVNRALVAKKKLLTLFLTVFAVLASTNVAWGKYYGYGRVVAVSDIPGKGKVAIATTYTYSTVNEEGIPWCTDSTTTQKSGKYSRPSVQILAKEEEGVTFAGWYMDEECTIEFDTYNYSTMLNPWNPSLVNCSTSADADAESITTTFYAKFAGEPKHHYAQIQYLGDEYNHGAFQVYNDLWELEYLYEPSSKDLDEVNGKASYAHTYNDVTAVPLRGYIFTEWTLTGEHATFTVDALWNITYTSIDNPSYITVRSSSEDAESPEVATIKPNFEALPTLSMTLRKAAGRGSVAVQYSNYEENAGGDGLELKTVNMESLGAAATEKAYSVYSTDEITLTATPASGYSFYGWYRVNGETGEKTLISEDVVYTFQPDDDAIYYAYFNTPITAADKFKVGWSLCQTFEQALAAVTESDRTILQVNDYTIPAGDYTIPAGVTLLVPRDANQKSSASPMREGNNSTPTAAYKVLTLASGATLNVLGEIEVGGTQNTAGTGATGTGRPNGSTYGQIEMQSGSRIIMNNGSELRAWGFVTGAGEIDVRRGAIVREMFQLYDFKGGSLTYAMLDNAGKVFPMNQYYIQNIEVPTKYRPGAALYGAMAAVDMGVNVKIVGIETDGAAMFKMANNDDSEDTWVRKWYDASSDQQVYEINNKAALSNLEMSLGWYGTFNSSEYTLPITNNMKIHLLSGEMEITQSTVMLPGSEMEVDKLATINVLAGQNLYFYDTDEWTACVYDNAYASKINYRPGGVPNVRNISSAAALGDAQINVHGTLLVNGALYTTESGANIYSSNDDAGTIRFESNAPAENSTLTHPTEYIYVGGFDSEVNYGTQVITPALLQNASGYRETASTTAGTSFCYINGVWRNMEQEDDCLVKDGTTYFAKPQDYVELKSGVEDENHLYYSADETRTFITALDGDGNCQWWEVEPVEGGLMHCLHPENNVYYFYNGENWQEKKFNVTFKNWDGEKLTFVDKESHTQDHYELRYGSMPQWYGSNPTRDTDPGYYTYDFIGWAPALSPVVADVEYTAQYEKKPVLYAITFNDEDGNLIEVTYCRRDETPVCQRHALAEGEHWEPAISLVTKEATYQLSTTTKTDNFTIQFVNWNGEVLHSAENVSNTTDAAGVAALYTGGTPVKASLEGEEEYEFAGWNPTIAAATADAVYTATFTVKTIAPLYIINEQTIADSREVSDLLVTTAGTLNVTGSVTATNFILESNGNNASGQLLGAANVTATNAYYDYKVNAKNHKWYSVAVPWQVDAESGIFVNGRTLEFGKDFDILYYDGAARAANGADKSAWKYMEDDYAAGNRILQPGKLYMIGLMGDAATIRFQKTGGALLTTNTTVTAYAESTNNDGKDANWNGIANPSLFHAYLNEGGTAHIAQSYNPADDDYSEINLATTPLVVGQPVFVQAPDAKTVVAYTSNTDYASHAPRRVASAETEEAFYTLEMTRNDKLQGRLFIATADEKEERYMIGQDVVKMGFSKTKAQMWINRYDAKLCMNTQALVNGVAEYPLTLFAPKADEYTIHSTPYTSDSDYDLYLTQNGEAIWNLSDGAYTFSLPKGNTAEYGLRISAKAPEVATGIDEAVVDAKGDTRKVLINNQVLIIRGNNIYSIDGRLVK